MKKLLILFGLSCLLGLLIILNFATNSVKQLAQLQITYFNIGQGDAALITTAIGEHVLIDCGPDQQILAALNHQLNWWEKKLDTIIISHDHADHWGGLSYLIDKYSIQKIILAKPPTLSPELSAILNTAQQKNIAIVDIRAPTIINLSDGSQLTVLWPTEQQLLKYQTNINNQSLVILWHYGQTSFLWTGDLETEAEEELLTNQPPGQPINIIKIAHHGSWTATGLNWLNYWQPSLAVISVGLNNQFNLPSQLVIKRLQRLGIRLWRTDQLADLHVFSNGQIIWR